MDKQIEICPPVILYPTENTPGCFREHEISQTLNVEGYIPRLVRITPDFEDNDFRGSGTSDNVIYVLEGDLTFHQEGEEDRTAKSRSTILVRKGTKYRVSTKSESTTFFSVVIHIPQ
jgi:hypothetical protein